MPPARTYNARRYRRPPVSSPDTHIPAAVAEPAHAIAAEPFATHVGADGHELPPEPAPSKAGPLARVTTWIKAHPGIVTILGSLIVGAALVFGLWDKRDEFAAAFTRLSVMTLIGAIALQVIWLVARCEAWHVCVAAAGATVGRGRLFRAGAIGYLGNVFNANFGVAVRIAALRRSAPAQSPKPIVLIAAEMPIIVIEIVLAALMSFTLVGPLGVPWYAPLAALILGAAIFYAVTRFAGRSHDGMWTGLAVMRGLRSRNRIVALVVAAVVMQAVRNFMILKGIGVEISFFDAIALLIATAALGLLPVGPSLGATAAILILGSSGVAVVAAGGALLTATGAAGCVIFALWAGLDRLRPHVRRESAAMAASAAAGAG